MPLIAPHGGTLVDRIPTGRERESLVERAAHALAVILDPWALADLELIATGAASPLTGFVGEADYRAILADLRLASGLPWSIPLTLRVDRAVARLLASRRRGDDLALRTPDGTTVGLLAVHEVYHADREAEARLVYGTADPEHPGVRQLFTLGDHAVAGDVWLLARPAPPFPALALDPAETRRAFEARGWSRVVGFQTRNPIHRAHEYIQKVALETVDGLLVHPLVGHTKSDDVPADVRVASYEVLLANYYPRDRVLLAAFPAAMRYAGPREAVFHAIARKNYGCSHFIVGRDHAGVGSYYGTYDAQRVFERFTAAELGIQPVPFEHTFYCRRCAGMASPKTCPHGSDAHVVLSGTAVRALLRAGELPPPEFSRPEVARLLAERLAERVQAPPAAPSLPSSNGVGHRVGAT
jgi:sulfate adenylyltransferase